MIDSSVTESTATAARQGSNKKSMNFGESLRVSREQQNYSIEDVSKAIHLSADIINAIDASDVGRLPEPAFVQGYLRVYARFLGVREAAVLEDYSNCVPHSLESELKRRSVLPHESHSGSPFIKTITIVLLVLACLAIVYGIYNYYSEVIDTKEADDEHEADQLFLPKYDTGGGQVYSKTSEASFGSKEIINTVQLKTNNDDNKLSATEKKSIKIDTAIKTVVEPAVVVKDVMWLRAKQASWVEVVDSDKVMLHYDLLKKGMTL